MAHLDRPVRIGSCSGFYGDRLSAAAELVHGGPLDVLAGDWLAELTMLILLRDKLKNPSGGYARTFLRQLQDVLPAALDRGLRIVSNAGGMNPRGLAAAVAELATKLGRAPRIAVVDGDDVMPKLQGWADAGLLRHLETGAALQPSDGMPMAAHAYLGCWGVAVALREGADIVITGRVTDAATVMGPAAWAHDWHPDDLDALAGALVAGHVVECGGQATGGNFSGYAEVPSLRHVGFPIAEIAADGSSVITKHDGTDGLVSVGTVTAQLLYEVGGPDYFSPDVIAHLDAIQLHQQGPDRVAITGVRGSAPTTTLKAGVLVSAGWRNDVTLLLGGADVARKAALVEDAFWPAVGGKERFAEARSWLLQADPTQRPDLRISRLTLAVADPDRDKVGRAFGAAAVELALCTVPGVTLADLPDDARPVGAFWPCLVPRADVPAVITLGDQTLSAPEPTTGPTPPPRPTAPVPPGPTPTGRLAKVTLGDLAWARSGDKAGNANVGLWVRHPGQLAWLVSALSEEAIRGWLEFTGPIRMTVLPNLLAVNVELVGWLGRGVAANNHPDPQAKCLAECLRTVEIEVDEAVLALTP
jgi:hypothetical protein